MPENAAISLDINESVARLLIERPPVNAFDEGLIHELNDALGRVEETVELSVLHIKSGLGVFSAGADLEVMKDSLATPEGRNSIIGVVRELQRAFARIEQLGVVSIAEIGGAAVGGGLEFALSCDLRIASEKAKLGTPEASLGLLPAGGGTQRLTRICGEAVARLVHWAVPHEELESRAGELATRIGAMPAAALAACKRCIAAASDHSIDGFELELKETERLHDGAEPARRIEKFLARSG
jgi:enoyl-CoA hydratase/carnithine racemase